MEQSTALIKQNGMPKMNDHPAMPADFVKPLEAFTKKMNEKPSKVDTSQGFESVPIDTVETELDEDFAGLWQTENFRWQVVANEIVGTIDLLVFHPIAKTWLRKTGSASVMIQQEKGAAIDDISKKYKNTLVKDFPKLEIMCIKSAAKKLGEKYGRSLNRKWIDSYEMIYTEEIEAKEAIDLIGKDMDSCKTPDDLVAIWNQHPDLQTNGHFKKHFSAAKTRIKLQNQK